MRKWCELCQQWETEVMWEERHVRFFSLTPKKEAVLTQERAEVLNPSLRLKAATAAAAKPQARPELSALAENVRRLRSALGLSQSALARLLGVQVLSIKRWEAGKVQPRQKILKRLEEFEAPSA